MNKAKQIVSRGEFIVFVAIAIFSFMMIMSFKVSDRDTTIDELEEKYSLLQIKHNDFMVQSERMFYQIEDLEEEIELLEDENTDLIEEVESLEEEKEELTEEVDELGNKVSKQSTQQKSKSSESSSQPNDSSSGWMNFEATWYTAFCDTGCIGITRTGYDVSNTIYSPEGHRVVAVDPNIIPLHSLVEVELENGTRFKAKALDTGGAIQGNIVDVLTTDTETAMRNGRQSVKVRVIDRG